MKKLNQKGFGAIEVLLLLILIAIVGGIGYYVWHQSKSNNTTTTSTPTSYSNVTKTTAGNSNQCGTGEAKDWAVATSYKKAFSMCVPDGWGLLINQEGDDAFYALPPFSLEMGKPAVIQNKSIGGSDGVRDIFSVYTTDKLYQGWTDDKATKTVFKLNDGTTGSRFYEKYGKQTSVDLGSPVDGEEAYEYQFTSKTDKLYQVVYVAIPPQKNEISTVELAIETLELK